MFDTSVLFIPVVILCTYIMFGFSSLKLGV